MPSDAVTAGNRRRDEFFSDRHRLRQILAERERGANRGGIGAAGAVRGNARTNGAERSSSVLPSKKISVASREFFKWPPFTKTAQPERERIFRAALRMASTEEIFWPLKISASARFGVTRVASGSSFLSEIFTAPGSQQLRAAGGNHHRIHH